MISGGKSNKEIATALFVAESTVKTHVATIYEKLRVTDRADAVVRAIQRGIIHVKPRISGGARSLETSLHARKIFRSVATGYLLRSALAPPESPVHLLPSLFHRGPNALYPAGRRLSLFGGALGRSPSVLSQVPSPLDPFPRAMSCLRRQLYLIPPVKICLAEAAVPEGSRSGFGPARPGRGTGGWRPGTTSVRRGTASVRRGTEPGKSRTRPSTAGTTRRNSGDARERRSGAHIDFCVAVWHGMQGQVIAALERIDTLHTQLHKLATELGLPAVKALGYETKEAFVQKKLYLSKSYL